MRRYDIQAGPLHYTSTNPDGTTNMAALAVDLDISLAAQSAPMGGSMVRIWGVGATDMLMTPQLLGRQINVSAGMAQGLPLATVQAPHYGLLCAGEITQAYSNWIGTDQNLTLLFVPSPTNLPVTGGPDPGVPSAKIVFNCSKGTSLLQAAVQAMQNAFPGWTINTSSVSKGQSFMAQAALTHYSRSIEDFSHYFIRLTQSPQYGGTSYQGLSIFANNKTIAFVDGPGSDTIQIQGYDLIGQPTYTGPFTIQFKTVMRADIVPYGKNVTLPSTWINSAPSDSALFAPSPILAPGSNLQVNTARHVGSSRQPSGEAWISIFDCTVLTSQNYNANNNPGNADDEGGS